jgi:hypothetical protein
MEGASPEMALARIYAAIGRLEAVATRGITAPGNSVTNSDDDLAVRHQTLRTAVSHALGQLDGLIAGQDR